MLPKKVAAVEKVRVAVQEDPRRAEEFALMKKHVGFYRSPIIDFQRMNTRLLGKAK
jgi:hypothetical protein